jgi:hypothetical protein
VTTAHEVERRVEQAAHGKWMERATALGFVAESVVYAVIGVYALRLALGEGGGLLGAHDTPGEVKRQPFGGVLLIALAIGLACHALWHFVRAWLAAHPGVSPTRRLARRIGDVGTGIAAVALSVTAFEHFAGIGTDHRTWIRRVLRADGGEWLLIAIGIGFIIAGVYQLRRAYTARFQRELETYEMSPTERRWLVRISRFGIAARGAVLPVVGWLFIRVARHTGGPDTSFGAALHEISRRTLGTALLAIIAAGLIAYALYMLVNARYRRVFA